MAIRKQEFYEGAALHLLARSGNIQGIRYEHPFFLLNENLLVHLKYSTRKRSPWGFTFTPDEQVLLQQKASELQTIIALVCGGDGVAAISYADYVQVAALRQSAVHIACYRDHRELYEVNGPDGRLRGKVSPGSWQRILHSEKSL